MRRSKTDAGARTVYLTPAAVRALIMIRPVGFKGSADRDSGRNSRFGRFGVSCHRRVIWFCEGVGALGAVVGKHPVHER